MAHHIAGVDIGSWSIKFFVIEAGFRQARPVDAFEERVGAGDEPLGTRQAQALARGMARLPRETTVFTALPGDLLTIRLLDLPFADARKIDQVVAYELEGQVVFPLDELVFDHEIRRVSGETGSVVLAVAARIDDVSGFLSALGAQTWDPRSLFAAPVIYQGLFSAPTTDESPSCRVLIDLGHQRTNICVLSGSHAMMARTLSRGGAALTAALAKVANLPLGEAETLKHEEGAVATADRPATSQRAQQIDGLLRAELQSLLRELRQTLAAVRARFKMPIEGLVLTGGGAGLRGLSSYLTAELDLASTVWQPEGMDGAGPSGVDASDAVVPLDRRLALAQAVAWAGARGTKQIDLRRGPFVYRANFSILRQRGLHLGILAAVVFLSITVDAWTSYSRSAEERGRLEAQLKAATTELFGTPNLDGRQVSSLLRRSFKDEMAPIPKATAYELMAEISKRVPGSDRIKLDIQELDIRSKKTTIKGTVDSAAAVDEIVSKLEGIDCFEEITRGSISEVSGGAKNFTLTIASKCP